VSIKHGAGIVTDELVLSYDGYTYSGDARFRKSWKGEPTVNEFGGATDFGQWTRESASVDVIDSGTYFQGEKVYKCKTQDGSVWISFNYTATGFITNVGTVNAVMSAWVKNPNDSSIALSAYIGHDFSGTKTIAANSDWQQIYWSVPVANMNNDYCEFRPYGNTPRKWLWMTMPQLEGSNSNYATPFTRIQRATNSALLDTAGNHTITLNNLLYDSTDGYFYSTGGPSTYIETGFGNGRNPSTNPVSYCFWVKKDAAGDDMFFVQGLWNASTRAYFGVISNQWGAGVQAAGWNASDSNVTVTQGVWYHVAIVFDGSNCLFYSNGVQCISKAYTSFSFNNTAQILGNTYDTQYNWLGRVDMTQIYNKALSAAEVNRNFNATRTRYGV